VRTVVGYAFSVCAGGTDPRSPRQHDAAFTIPGSRRRPEEREAEVTTPRMITRSPCRDAALAPASEVPPITEAAMASSRT